MDKQCGDLLSRICRKYDDLAAVDKLSSVSQKVESVKLVMQDNIDIALQNCVKLESIGKAAGKVTTSLFFFLYSGYGCISFMLFCALFEDINSFMLNTQSTFVLQRNCSNRLVYSREMLRNLRRECGGKI